MSVGRLLTLMPVLVASLTASSRRSYLGLKVSVKAQSMIRPAGIYRRRRRSAHRGQRCGPAVSHVSPSPHHAQH